jgi:DnaJ-domain-containing protein 1
MTLGAVPQRPPSDDGPGTAIEVALGERACSVGAQASVIDPEAHAECVNAQIAALRADFGRDLRRLSAVERKRFDAACARMNTAVTREAYLDCLNGEILARRQRSAPAQSAVDAAAPASSEALAADAVPRHNGGRGWLPVLAGVAILLAVPGVVVALRRRQPRERQRPMCACGQSLVEEGAMCAACRRAAAEALKRSREEAQQNQELEAQRRKQKNDEEEQRLLTARRAAEEAERQTQIEETLRLESDQDRIAQEAAALRRFEAEEAARSEARFDPYAVLGVAPESDLARIRAAYEAAKAKYQPDAVSHLGDDVQQHFRIKAEAVDRAYEILSGLAS